MASSPWRRGRRQLLWCLSELLCEAADALTGWRVGKGRWGGGREWGTKALGSQACWLINQILPPPPIIIIIVLVGLILVPPLP